MADPPEPQALNEAGLRHARAARQHAGERSEREFERAVEVFRSALERDPDYVPARVNLGAALSDLGRHREALSVLKPLAKAGCPDANLWFNLGVVRANLGHDHRAREAFRRSEDLESDPLTREAYFDPHGH